MELLISLLYFRGIPMCTVISMGICAIQAHAYGPLLSNSNRENTSSRSYFYLLAILSNLVLFFMLGARLVSEPLPKILAVKSQKLPYRII